MKVILNADVPNLGEEGDVREVKRGYARNYLMPRNMAMPFNKQSMAVIESRRALIEKRKEEKRAQAQGLKQRLEALTLNLSMPAGENGRLFGAVTSATVAEELSKQGISIERKRIEIPEHTIKASGNYRVHIRLYGNEEAALRVLVNQQAKSDAPEGAKPETTEAEAAPQETPRKEEVAAAAETAEPEPESAEAVSEETDAEADESDE
ncbi:50S ribosomal protein L9 [Salinispira pacifica]